MFEPEKTHQLYHDKVKPNLKIVKEKNFTYRHLLQTINRHLKAYSLKILDIGCGAGTLSIYAASKGHSVVGIDISSKAIRACNKSAKELKLKNLSFQKMEFPNVQLKEKYDIAIFTEVIEHLPNDVLSLNKINKLLNKNGTLILSTPAKKAPLNRLNLTIKFDNEVGHLRRYELRSLKKLIVNAGFKILETQKTEGIIRNFLFINPLAGKLVRFLNYSSLLSDIFTFLDNITLKLFGESNYIIVAKKVEKKITI